MSRRTRLIVASAGAGIVTLFSMSHNPLGLYLAMPGWYFVVLLTYLGVFHGGIFHGSNGGVTVTLVVANLVVYASVLYCGLRLFDRKKAQPSKHPQLDGH